MDVILAALAGFVLLVGGAFVNALIRHDAPLWVVALGRGLVHLSVRFQSSEEQEIMGSVAEFEALATQVRTDERTVSSVVRFGCSLLARQVVGAAMRAVRSRSPLDLALDVTILLLVLGPSLYAGLLVYVVLSSAVLPAIFELLVSAGIDPGVSRGLVSGPGFVLSIAVTGLLVSRYPRIRRWVGP